MMEAKSYLVFLISMLCDKNSFLLLLSGQPLLQAIYYLDQSED